MNTNPYINLNRIEFLVTLQCTGKCKHCSVGARLNEKGSQCVKKEKAMAAVEKLAGMFPIASLMTFGGEPLLYPEVTCAIHSVAKQCHIKQRQLITNGFFSRETQVIRETAENIYQSGINDILLSVDAFHQETIPLAFVRLFAEELIKRNVHTVCFHPAWVVNADHQNSYNKATHTLLASLSDLGIKTTSGNNIFPAGNASTYLKDFYKLPENLDLSATCGELPYTNRLDDVQSVSIGPNGDISVCAFVIGNIYEDDIASIVAHYNPFENDMMNALIDGGVNGLLCYANKHGKQIDTHDCYSPCSVCHKIRRAFL